MSENSTEEGKIRKAYLEGLKLKKSGLNEEVIYAKLEKQGFSETLAKEVARNVTIEGNRDLIQGETYNLYTVFLKVGVALIMALISFFIIPGKVFIPVGFIIGGIVYAILTMERINRLK